MDKKPKKVKIDLSQPDQKPDLNDPNVFIDNSAEELKQLQQDMLRRRMERQNEDDSLQIKLKPAEPPQSSFQNLLSPEDKQRVIASLNRDPKQEIKDYFQKMNDDQSRAMEIASRGPFQEKTPEEQEFADKQLGPMLQGLMGGGAIGSVGNAAKQVVPAFNKLQQMMKIGNKRFPIQNTAQGLKVQDALQQTGEVLPGKFGRVLLKDR